MEALEEQGFNLTGRCLQLNSYENRVFELELESSEKVVAKFYRPQRWSYECILEEHQFLFDLKSEGIHVVAPLKLSDQSTLKECQNILFSVFPKCRGRSPQELINNDYKSVGELLAQVHNIGSRSTFSHRPVLTVEEYGYKSLEALEPFLSIELKNKYLDVAETVLECLEDDLLQFKFHRIHGDCHRGNLLQSSEGFFFVDFDDCCMGPSVQDFWMLAKGDEEETKRNWDELLEGYTRLRSFNEEELILTEPLRALRMIYYSGWIARRWKDPSFPKLFPEYSSYLYWLKELQEIEKIAEVL